MKTITATKKQIINGFVQYKAKLGATKVIYQTLPTEGVWYSDGFYSNDFIVQEFIDNAAKSNKFKLVLKEG